MTCIFCIEKRSLSMPLDDAVKKLKKAKVQKVDYHTQQNDEIMVNLTSTSTSTSTSTWHATEWRISIQCTWGLWFLWTNYCVECFDCSYIFIFTTDNYILLQESARVLLQGMPTYEEHLQVRIREDHRHFKFLTFSSLIKPITDHIQAETFPYFIFSLFLISRILSMIFLMICIAINYLILEILIFHMTSNPIITCARANVRTFALWTTTQSYIDAEDPDNGIEAEYHPKKDRWVERTAFLWHYI